MKKFFQDYLTFSRRDRLGIIALVFLLAVIYILPKFFGKTGYSAVLVADSTFEHSLKPVKNGTKSSVPDNIVSDIDPNQNNGSEPFKKGMLFSFDPNTLDAAGWEKLGLNERIVRIIQHYREKGGRFRKPEDLQKIWGFPEPLYNRVRSYIHITQEHKDSSFRNYAQSFPAFHKEAGSRKKIDINLADTSEFIALPGIGSRLASRIVNFRNKLGGFYSTEQIGETYGLPDSVFRSLKPFLLVEGGHIRKLNINIATKEQLKDHPYIRWNLANAIIEYRNQHGIYKDLEELKNIALITTDIYQKIAPYLSL